MPAPIQDEDAPGPAGLSLGGQKKNPPECGGFDRSGCRRQGGGDRGYFFASLIAACAAARRATGTR